MQKVQVISRRENLELTFGDIKLFRKVSMPKKLKVGTFSLSVLNVTLKKGTNFIVQFPGPYIKSLTVPKKIQKGDTFVLVRICMLR